MLDNPQPNLGNIVGCLATEGSQVFPRLACTQQGENRWENGVCEVFCSLVGTLQAAWWLFAMVGAVVYLIG